MVDEQGKPQMMDVARCPHSSGPRYQDTQKRGVSRLAAIHAAGGHIKFLSGGYDGTIHEWTADVDKLNEARSRNVVSHGTCIMALAYRDRDRSVVASAQTRLHITDLNRSKTTTHPFSNQIRQIHIHPQAAYLTLLEVTRLPPRCASAQYPSKVRHLDRQVQLYDSRKADFDSEPCLSFGHRNTHGTFSGGHTRGSVHLVHFAKASEDGHVLLWDFRNSKVGSSLVATGRRCDESSAQRGRWSRGVSNRLRTWYTPSLRIGTLLRLDEASSHSLRTTCSMVYMAEDGDVLSNKLILVWPIQYLSNLADPVKLSDSAPCPKVKFIWSSVHFLVRPSSTLIYILLASLDWCRKGIPKSSRRSSARRARCQIHGLL